MRNSLFIFLVFCLPNLHLFADSEPDPVTVVSDPSGNSVVVQVGDEYSWNSSLDGVILWSVEWEPGELPDPYTYYFIDGRNTGDIGFHDSVSDSAPYDKPYMIDENGYLKVTESSFQYYNVISVEDGVIETIQDDGGVDSVADNGINIVDQWFFTTREAAEEFYNSKIDFAPESIVGKTLYIPDGYDSNYSFTADEVYIIINDPNTILGGFSYSYVSNSATSATLEISGNSNEIHQLTFTSPTRADSNFSATDGNGSLTLQILEENYVPNSLAGWTYKGSSMNDTLQFTDSSNAVFYDSSDSNFSRRELSNITYTLEQLGPRIAKLSTSLDEETLLFFNSDTSGHFDWEEMGAEDGVSGQFDLYYYASGHALDSLVGSSITLGETTYIFTSTNTVMVHSPNEETTSQEYSYLKESEDEGILSVGSSLWKLDFYNHQYGRIIEGGSGYFAIHHKWATKGWVYYDELPWIYSNNQGEWLYQVLSVNSDSNETELMYFEPWNNLWSQNLDLNFTDQRVFSADSEFYWEDYDDFNGTELNSSKWDVGYWGGGEVVTINDGKAQLSGGAFSSVAPIQMPSDLVAASQDSTEGNTFLFFNDEDIYGIQADISIPSQTNEYDAGIYLASLDTNPLGSLGAELRYRTSGSVLLFDYLESGNELEHLENGSLDTFYQLQIIKVDGKTSHYLNGYLIKQFESSSHDEDYWTIGAFNDAGLAYTTYADNVRVLRKKTYPKGWMWTEYYPWAYSYETGGWLYFELAKDTDGNPVMNYYDHSTGSWDLYGPSKNQLTER